MYRFFTSVRRRPLLAAALALVCASLLLVACGDDDAPGEATATATSTGGAEFPRTITDSSGAAVTLASQPRRIVSLSPAATEILFAIGAGDRIVGSDTFSNYPDAAEDTDKLDYSKPDPEAALALDPDLVIMVTRQQEQVPQFRDLGMTVLYFEEAETVEGVYDSIELLGELTGGDAEAERLVAGMRQRVDALTSKLAGVAAGPRVFYEITTDLYTVSDDTFIGSMLALLKAKNVAAGASSKFPQLTAEAVIASDPEVVLLADAKFTNENLETVSARPGWANVSAVRNRRVVAIDDDIASRPGPRIVDAMEAIAKALYPDRFP
ncbi:MAG: ABC transporter substrate-binding protein [Dehalococcoidia bacterium]